MTYALSDTQPGASTRPAERLPLAGLLALAMTGFIAILTETLPAGLLPQIGNGLGVSQAFAGQMVTLYALGSVLAAIPLTAATRTWRRKPLLLLAIGGFFVFNTVTALSSSYWLTLVARFFAGVAAGLTWGLVPIYARQMVIGPLQGKAMAVALVGTPIALSLGVPVGTWLGTMMGWRNAFGIMSAMTLALTLWVLWKAPDVAGQSGDKALSIRKVFLSPGIRPVLFVILVWMVAHNILYTYIAPFLVSSGLNEHVDLVLLVFGIMALVGIWITGALIDRWLRVLVLLSLAAFAVASTALGLDGSSTTVVYLAVGVWGLTFGGAATLLQTASADAAGDGADLAQSMIVTVWNFAIALGGIVGGVVLDTWGANAFPWLIALLLLAGLVAAWQACAHGFTPGQRA